MVLDVRHKNAKTPASHAIGRASEDPPGPWGTALPPADSQPPSSQKGATAPNRRLLCRRSCRTWST